MKEVKILLPWGGGEQTPNTIITHSMMEYIDCDAQTAEKLGIRPGIYHASIWLHILKLSAHILISPNGVAIRHREDNQIAFHAKNHNENTLGAEFLVPGIGNYQQFLGLIKNPYLTPSQIQTGIELYRSWRNTWDIVEITTHHKIDPTRKPDPGDGFNKEILEA